MIDGAGTNYFVTLMIFMNYISILKIGISHTKVHISPTGGGRVLPFMLRYTVKGMVFKQFTLE